MPKPLLILKTGQTLAPLRARNQDFEHWIIRGMAINARHIVLVNAFADEPLPALDSIAGMVVTGSPAMVTDREAWSERSAQYMGHAVRLGVPLLGICYGHQLLAHACGGIVGYHPAGREIGTVTIENTPMAQQDTLFGALLGQFNGHTTHSQTVLKLPERAVLLARSEHDAHQAFRIGTNAWGVQFHPEFDAEIMRSYVFERREDLLAEGFDIDTLMENIAETPQATALLQRFAQLAGFN